MKKSNQYIVLEEKKVKELASEYKKKGYQVFMYPKKDEIPKFLKSYEPDLIVKNDIENLVIEVKSKFTMQGSTQLKTFIELIDKEEGWNFELVLTNPRKRNISAGEEIETTSQNEINIRLSEVERLLENEFLEPSFLMLWSIFEAISRRSLSEYKKESSKQTLSLIKELFSYGLINRNEYTTLEILFRQRNYLVHGFYHKTQKITKQKVIQFKEMLEKLNENKI